MNYDGYQWALLSEIRDLLKEQNEMLKILTIPTIIIPISGEVKEKDKECV